MTRTLKPAPSTQDFDREFRAQVAQMTSGLAPTPFTTAWADWAMHLAIAPAKQREVASHMLERVQDTCTFAMRAATGARASPGDGLADGADPHMAPDEWVEAAAKHDGSWWPALPRWFAGHSNKRIAPPSMGAARKGYRVIEDAPGTFVRQRWR